MSETVDQQDLKPTRKVTGSTTSAAAGILVVFVAGELGHPVSAEVAAAIVTLLAFAGGFFTRERKDTP